MRKRTEVADKNTWTETRLGALYFQAMLFGGLISLQRSAVILMVIVVLLGAEGKIAGLSAAENGRQDTPGVSAARDYPRVELFGGYSHLPERDSFIKPFADPGRGWGAGLNWNFRRSFGLFVDVDSHRWTLHERRSSPGGFVLGSGSGPLMGNEFYIGDQDLTLYYLSAGPRAVVRSDRFAVFGLAALEFQHSHSSEHKFADATSTIVQPGGSSRAYGFGLGGGADVSLTSRVAIRAVQINYSLAAFGEGPGRKLRIKTGIVFKFD